VICKSVLMIAEFYKVLLTLYYISHLSCQRQLTTKWKLEISVLSHSKNIDIETRRRMWMCLKQDLHRPCMNFNQMFGAQETKLSTPDVRPCKRYFNACRLSSLHFPSTNKYIILLWIVYYYVFKQYITMNIANLNNTDFI
jgi:hypothetical protein